MPTDQHSPRVRVLGCAVVVFTFGFVICGIGDLLFGLERLPRGAQIGLAFVFFVLPMTTVLGIIVFHGVGKPLRYVLLVLCGVILLLVVLGVYGLLRAEERAEGSRGALRHWNDARMTGHTW